MFWNLDVLGLDVLGLDVLILDVLEYHCYLVAFEKNLEKTFCKKKRISWPCKL